MSPYALRASGAILGLGLGVVAAWLADALPRRYGITHLTTGKRRTTRNAVVVGLVTACGAALGDTLARASSLDAMHAVFLLATNLAVTSALIAAAAIDLEHMILPNELTLGGALVCVVSSPLRHVGLAGALVGALTGLVVAYVPFLAYKKLRGRSGMGLGDAKLAMLAGAWHGALGAVLVLLGGAVLMPIFAGIMRALGVSHSVPESVRAELAELRMRADAGDAEARAELADDPMAADIDESSALTTRLPLGPFLAVSCVVVLFCRRWLEAHVLAWLLG